MLEKVAREVQSCSSSKEFDQHVHFARAAMEDLQKEVVLRATIKDVCTLLD